ncbi:uncharacterized protein LOC117282771 [Cryptotermes secundus]|uniref:uncharacterized protein LOC117282771 n=1 Tax=Cryptotermes secundus TaxID=105785 RepID=UPI001454E120|nr:uncharacterized protein LOC117282771 [Cryptotermes secundus]
MLCTLLNKHRSQCKLVTLLTTLPAYVTDIYIFINCSIGTATDYGLEDRSSILGRGKRNFSSLQSPERLCGLSGLLSSELGSGSLGIQWPGRDTSVIFIQRRAGSYEAICTDHLTMVLLAAEQELYFFRTEHLHGSGSLDQGVES